uniref:Uncharacterized protein n=1 Tax=Romanomermis culicivorax TaxID=13658 RepID=A0A915K894_ROMCU
MPDHNSNAKTQDKGILKRLCDFGDADNVSWFNIFRAALGLIMNNNEGHQNHRARKDEKETIKAKQFGRKQRTKSGKKQKTNKEKVKIKNGATKTSSSDIFADLSPSNSKIFSAVEAVIPNASCSSSRSTYEDDVLYSGDEKSIAPNENFSNKS